MSIEEAAVDTHADVSEDVSCTLSHSSEDDHDERKAWFQTQVMLYRTRASLVLSLPRSHDLDRTYH